MHADSDTATRQNNENATHHWESSGQVDCYGLEYAGTFWVDTVITVNGIVEDQDLSPRENYTFSGIWRDKRYASHWETGPNNARSTIADCYSYAYINGSTVDRDNQQSPSDGRAYAMTLIPW